MLVLEERDTKSINKQDSISETCIYDDTTVICGKIYEVDYLNRVESKMIPEPFYGDIDLFGF